MPKSRGLRMEPLEERQLLTVLTWDPDGNAANGFGGTGNWTGGSYWYNQTTQTYVEWNNANNDEAVFQGSVGMVTVNSAVSAAKVTFQSTDGYIINGGSALTLNGSGETITASQSATISAAINVGSDQQWTVASTKTVSVGGNVDLASHALTVGGAGDAALAGVISGTGGNLTKDGAGTVTLSGVNTYTGGTAIQNGTLQLGVTNALPTTTTITFGTATTNGTLELNGFNQQVSGLAVVDNATAASQIIGNSSTIANATLTVDLTNAESIFGGTIKDAISGTGTHSTSLTVTSANMGNGLMLAGARAVSRLV